jgi:hypothetical protein
MVLPVSADENLVSENGATILEQIKINSGIKPTDNIFNTELYTDSLKGYNFQNDTILKVYPIYFWENADKDFDTRIDIYLSWAKTDAFDYIVFRENILRMRELRFKSGKVTVGLNPTYPDQDSLVWKDIINSSFMSSDLFDPSSDFTKIVCFDQSQYFEEIIVYYVQENSTVVWVYQDHYTPHVEFTLEKFNTYAKAFDESLIFNDTDKIYGGIPSFLNFVKLYDEGKIPEVDSDNQNKESVDKEAYSDKVIDKTKHEKDSKISHARYVAVPCVLAVIAVSVVSVLIYHKKKAN